MSITPESTPDLAKKAHYCCQCYKEQRTGGWLQQEDSLRDMIGESFKAQRQNVYFHHYMLFALLNVCYCHQRPHYVTIRNPESHKGRGKKTVTVSKMNDRLNKKKFLFFYV